jgi:transcriptional regulator PpsR
MIKAPQQSPDLSLLSEHVAELAELFVRVSSDIALLLNSEGVIQKVVLDGANPGAFALVSGDWVGRTLEDTVTDETRKKAGELLQDVALNGVSRMRHLNHPNPSGPELAFAYTAVQLSTNGPLLAVGRDLRTVVAMQQRFVETQREMERNYWKVRQTESRYQLLFQIATEAVLVIDTVTLGVTDANQAAARLFGLPTEQLVGKLPTIGIDPEFAPPLESLLDKVLTTGRSAEIRVKLAKGRKDARVTVTKHEAGGPTVLILSVRVIQDQALAPVIESQAAALVERTDDAIVVVSEDGSITMANRAFSRMTGSENDEQLLGRSLIGWLGTSERIVESCIALLTQSGTMPLIRTSLRSAKGNVMHVELSGTLLPSPEALFFGFIVRPVEVDSRRMVRDVVAPDSQRKIH